MEETKYLSEGTSTAAFVKLFYGHIPDVAVGRGKFDEMLKQYQELPEGTDAGIREFMYHQLLKMWAFLNTAYIVNGINNPEFANITIEKP